MMKGTRAKVKLFEALEDATLYFELGHLSRGDFMAAAMKAARSFLDERAEELRKVGRLNPAFQKLLNDWQVAAFKAVRHDKR